MSGSRSKNGCWTCRLRRKKCDESHPVCHACAFRNVTCHGYGPQPFWMDGGVLEEAELAKTKQIVGQSYRTRRMLRLELHDGGPDLGNSKSSDAQQAMEEGDRRPGARVSDLVHKTRLPRTFHRGLSSDPTVWLPGPRDISHHQELGKISYFFDRVFPIQHPFHSHSDSAPNPEKQWLQTMLFETNHYHLSALAISALHQNNLVDNEDTEEGRKSTSESLEYHSLAVNALRDRLSSLDKLAASLQLKAKLGLLASMIQLVSFEVIRESKPFKGDIGNWEIHLDGAEALLDIIYFSSSISVHEVGLDFQMKSPHHPGTWNTNIFWIAHELQPSEIIGFEFLTAVYVWADICRCASVGWHYRIGQVYPYKRYIDEGRIHLSSVMGCSNWAMSCIMDITQLEAWKNQGLLDDSYEVAERRRQGAIIQQRLIVELKNQWLISASLTIEERDKILITWAYGICALIYLHIVIFDAGPGDSAIHENVKRAVIVMEAMSPQRLRSISWPFCVAGCMATGEEKNTIQRIFQSASDRATSLGTIWSGFAVVKECWKQRAISKDWCEKGAVCWRRAMDSLGVKILLI